MSVSITVVDQHAHASEQAFTAGATALDVLVQVRGDPRTGHVALIEAEVEAGGMRHRPQHRHGLGREDRQLRSLCLLYTSRCV